MTPKTGSEMITLNPYDEETLPSEFVAWSEGFRQAESELLPKIEALDKSNTEKETQIVSLQSRIDFQVEANDILYADQKKELKNVIAGKIALQSEVERLKADNEAQLEAGRNIAKAHLECMAERNELKSKHSKMVEALRELKKFESLITTPSGDIRYEMSTVSEMMSVVRFSDIDKIIEQSKGE